MLKLLGMITPEPVLILMICQRFIMNYSHEEKVIPLTGARALPIYAQTQQRFLIVRIHKLAKITFHSAGFTTESVI